jgi:hypothetical protein
MLEIPETQLKKARQGANIKVKEQILKINTLNFIKY